MMGYRSFHPSLREYAWIGGAEVNGKWVWKGDVVDSPILMTDWAEQQPDNDKYGNGDQDCLGLFGDSAATSSANWFRWDDGSCSDAMSFICEKPV